MTSSHWAHYADAPLALRQKHLRARRIIFSAPKQRDHKTHFLSRLHAPDVRLLSRLHLRIFARSLLSDMHHLDRALPEELPCVNVRRRLLPVDQLFVTPSQRASKPEGVEALALRLRTQRRTRSKALALSETIIITCRS